ncbi:hypothetical protein CDL12_27485 [Handroanthus impetiginosus]|uniref:Uncharacterized protein n=1 Tax=Handroanthus impetiginosus TaxID=429701 RepID=A0A2G9G3X4_9LAMI|nr:hypothetical protein CDL12_27485 [Handroanthus impetiginosus]
MFALSLRGLGAQLIHETLHLGSTVSRLKLKGIDRDLRKQWSMWFNSIQREKPYWPLTYGQQNLTLMRWYPLSYRCCMAILACLTNKIERAFLTCLVKSSFGPTFLGDNAIKLTVEKDSTFNRSAQRCGTQSV